MKTTGWPSLLVLAFCGSALAQQGGIERSPAPRSDRSPAPSAPGTPPAVAEREFKGRAGRDMRVLVVTNVRPDCSSGPLPSVRLVTPPAHGKIVIRRGRLNATNVRHCLAITIPALVGIYRSASDFEGDDSAVVEIRPENGPPRLQRLKFIVTKAAQEQSI